MTISADPPEIEIESLGLFLAGRQVIDIARLVIPQGSLILLTGPNGSGKTTLLKILAGLVEPAKAYITCNGNPISTKRAMRYWRGRNIYLHQNPYLFDGSVSENIEYGLCIRGLSQVQRDIEVAEALRWARLEHLADRVASTLSTGEKQRIAFTRAKVMQPAVLLIDETLSNMDSASREQSYDVLTDLTSSGMSIIVASHEIDQFSEIADLHLQLDNGQLLDGENNKIVPLRPRHAT